MVKLEVSEDAAVDAAAHAVIESAAARLDAGRLVAFPTETVYGLGADASDPQAVAAIFRAKGRPSDHPLIVHVPEGSDPGAWASDVPPVARRLIDRFWPGPLTLILPRRVGVGDAAAGGQGTIGLRCPGHPIAQALLAAYASRRAGRDRGATIGIAAPSANRFGHVSPTSAAHVREEFADGFVGTSADEFARAATTDASASIFILDGGDCPVGIESTIVDCSRLGTIGPVLLRPGHVSAAMIEDAIGVEVRSADPDAPRASGTLVSHYAPATPMRLVDTEALRDAPDDVAVWSSAKPALQAGSHWRVAPRDAVAYAHELYAALRALDAIRAREIWIERPPQTAAWAAVNDRLKRAASRESLSLLRQRK